MFKFIVFENSNLNLLTSKFQNSKLSKRFELYQIQSNASDNALKIIIITLI